MKTCSVDGCVGRHEARGFCEKHYKRWKRYGAPIIVTAERGSAINNSGYRNFNGRLEHITVAEKAIGHRLPAGAVVHHMDYNKTNNLQTNLLVCSRAYHRVIHQRTDAFMACGNADWRRCGICQQYDAPINLACFGTSAVHNACRRRRHKEKKSLKSGFDVPGARLVLRDRLSIK